MLGRAERLRDAVRKRCLELWFALFTRLGTVRILTFPKMEIAVKAQRFKFLSSYYTLYTTSILYPSEYYLTPQSFCNSTVTLIFWEIRILKAWTAKHLNAIRRQKCTRKPFKGKIIPP